MKERYLFISYQPDTRSEAQKEVDEIYPMDFDFEYPEVTLHIEVPMAVLGFISKFKHASGMASQEDAIRYLLSRGLYAEGFLFKF